MSYGIFLSVFSSYILLKYEYKHLIVFNSFLFKFPYIFYFLNYK